MAGLTLKIQLCLLNFFIKREIRIFPPLNDQFSVQHKNEILFADMKRSNKKNLFVQRIFITCHRNSLKLTSTFLSPFRSMANPGFHFGRAAFWGLGGMEDPPPPSKKRAQGVLSCKKLNSIIILRIELRTIQEPTIHIVNICFLVSPDFLEY